MPPLFLKRAYINRKKARERERERANERIYQKATIPEIDKRNKAAL